MYASALYVLMTSRRFLQDHLYDTLFGESLKNVHTVQLSLSHMETKTIHSILKIINMVTQNQTGYLSLLIYSILHVTVPSKQGK